MVEIADHFDFQQGQRIITAAHAARKLVKSSGEVFSGAEMVLVRLSQVWNAESIGVERIDGKSCLVLKCPSP